MKSLTVDRFTVTKYLLSALFLGWMATMVLSTTGCATAPSFDQQLAIAYQTQTGILQTTQTALARKVISTKEAESVLKISDEASDFLDEAQQFRHSNAKGAEASLDLATRILDELVEYLSERGI